MKRWDSVELGLFPRLTGFDDPPDLSAARSVRIVMSFVVERNIRNVIDDHYNDVGRGPVRLLLGWKTWTELRLIAANRCGCEGLPDVDEYMGIPIIVDPSRENYAQAIEPRELTGCSKGPFTWSGDE